MDRPEIYPFKRADKDKSERPGFQWPSWPRVVLLGSGVHRRLKTLTRVFDLETVVLWLVAFLLGRSFILGEVLPFAAAFAAAFASKNRKLAWGIPLFSILGLITMAEGYLMWGNALAIVGVSFLPQFMALREPRRWVALPLLTLSIMVVTKTLFLLLNNPNMYLEIVIFFEAIAAGILTFVLMVVREVIDEAKPLKEFNLEDAASFIILGIGVLIGLAGVSVFGVSLSGITCRLGIILAAFLWGIGGGTVVGVAVGVIPAMANLALPKVLAIYALSGLLAGVFRTFGRLGVGLGFVTGSLIMSVLMMDSQQAISGLWETGLAVAAFLLLPRDFQNHMPVRTVGPLGYSDKEEAATSHLKQWTAERMNNLAKVFEEISMTFVETEAVEPVPQESSSIGRVLQNISEVLCRGCSLYKTCWEREFYQTYRDFFNLVSLTEIKGQLEFDDLPVEVKRRCLRSRDLSAAVNRVLETTRINEFWEEKIEESRDLISQQLKGVSGVIKNLAQELDLKTVVDSELQERLMKDCKELGVPVKQVVPVIAGNNQVFIRVTAEACLDRETCDNLLAPGISALMDTRYEVSHRKCPRGNWGTCEFTLARAFNFRINTGVSQLAKRDVSGDSFNVVTLKDGRELIVLSDGMGVGRKAARESKATVNLLEELFNTGFGQEVAIKTVNSVLMLRQRESFATVDLALIDLYSGEIESIKIGGVPSFLKRGGRVGIISSSNLPIGVVEDLDIPTERRAMLPGDMLVMVTDGVLDPGKLIDGRGLWLRDFLARTSEQDPHRLSEMIINKALALARGEPRDDMTVICARVDRNQG
ncbi:MAG: stage II sporulation protein E [Syntrophomonadaceae bacterium]|nr:stage II sporulation protein E [Syntrophomonadaceae bacterium]